MTDASVLERAAQFVPFKADIDSETGKALARRFAVTRIPTVVFLDGNGREVHRFSGAIPPQEFLAELDKAVMQAGTSKG